MERFKDSKFLYLTVVAVTGLALLLAGLYQLPRYEPLSTFLLLVALAATSAITTTSVRVSQKAGITYQVDNAIAIASVPLFTPLAAPLVVSSAIFFGWLAKRKDDTTWKKSLEQLAFNVGMVSISMALAGASLNLVRSWLGAVPVVGTVLPWIVAAIVYGQVNAWLLIGILHLQHRQNMRPLEVWRDNRWYMFLDILIMSIGGGLLAFAAAHYDWLGVVIFFLPVILSSFAFRLYVRQMQTHMDNLEGIVAERTRELRKVNKEKDAFLAVLTHDMKTPLTSIGLYAGMLERRPELILEKPGISQILVRNQQTLLEIVNNIMVLEQVGVSGTLPVEKEEFDLVALVESVVEMLRPQAESKEMTIQSYLFPSPLLVYADPGQIGRILRNLISNAIKYSPPGGQVAVEVEQQEEMVICRVCDKGYGIPADEIEHIFERYRRVKKHKDKAEGTGLGLAVTHALVELYNGTIEVESEEEVGSNFTVNLPIACFP